MTRTMIQPVELVPTLPIALHGGLWSTTTKVWEMLSASRAGDLVGVARLLDEQPALGMCQYNYTPPLHLAVREGHAPIVRLLVDRQAFDPQYRTYPFKDSLLTIARDRGHGEVMRILEDALRQPDLTRKWVDTGEIDYGHDDEQRRFEGAVHAGRVETAERLLERRPTLAGNQLSSWGEGVLMMPAKDHNIPMLELLLRFGAQVPVMSKWGRFYYFAHDDIAALLLERGMSARHTSWHHVTLLHDMAHAGDIKKARLLLDHGADINAVDEEYCTTPLGIAARWGQRETATFLLDQGADPNASGADWSTPLAWARSAGHAAIASDLLAAGAVAH